MTDATVPPTLDALLAHREWVRRFARTLAADDASADDLAQDVWVTAVEHPPRHASAPAGWLKRVLQRRAIDLSRERSRRVARETATARGEARAGTDEVVAVAESHRRVVEAVMALDEPYRTTILLRFFEDLPPRDVAVRMGVPVETVRSRVRRACELLRGRLDDEHGGNRAAWIVPLLGARRADAAPAVRAARSGPWRWLVTAAAVAGAAGLWIVTDPGEGEAPDGSRTAEEVMQATRGVRAGRPRHAKSDTGEVAPADTAADSPPVAGPAPVADPNAPHEFVVRVVDTNRAPVFGVSVRIDPADMKDELDAVSDADGRAVFQVVGKVRTARAQPRSSDGRIWRPVVQRVPVAPHDKVVDYVVRRGASIRGTVRREDGRPFAFAGVLAVEHGRTVASTYADKSGEYELAVPETGTWDIVFSGMSHEEFGTFNSPTGRTTHVMDRGYGPMDGEVANVGPGAQGVDFTISKAVGTGTVRVLVRLPDGRPLAGVAVFADTGSSSRSPETPPLTDADGRAQLEGIPNCRCALSVAGGPADPRPWEELGCMPPSETVRVRPGGAEAVIEFRPARAIRGVLEVPEDFVRHSPERPEVAWLYLFEGETQLAFAACGADGRFTIMAPASSPGPFRLKAFASSADGRRYEASSEFAAAATDVRLVLATRDPPPPPKPPAPAGTEEGK